MTKKRPFIRKKRSSGLQKARNVLRNSIPVSVIVDTREKDPWTFEGKLPSNLYIKQIYFDKLDAGDYCIIGHELPTDDYGLIIERKASLEEFIGNIGRSWDRFQLELDKMSNYQTAVIIIEDDLSSAFSKYKSRSGHGKYFNVSPNFIVKRVSEIQSRYGVSTYFMSTKYFAQRLACNLFKDMIILDGELDE